MAAAEAKQSPKATKTTMEKSWEGKDATAGSYVYKYPFEFQTTIPPRSATVTSHCWTETDPSTVKVRGPTYLDDAVKIPAVGAYTFLGIDMFKSDNIVEHICARSDNPVQKLLSQYAARGEKAPFILAINFLMPWGQLVGYWTSNNPTPYIGDTKFDKLMAGFLTGDDEYRNSRFKVIPRMVEGNWAVKKAVGEKPAIIGKKITHRYHKGDGYFEIDCDIQSSKIAKGILMMVMRYTKSVTIDLCFLFEAQSSDELPERLLGGLRFHGLDPDLCPKLAAVPASSPTAASAASPPLERKVSSPTA